MESADDRILGEGDEGIPTQASKVFGIIATVVTVGVGLAFGSFVSYDKMIDQKAKGLVFGEFEDFMPPTLPISAVGGSVSLMEESQSSSESLSQKSNPTESFYPTPVQLPATSQTSPNPCKPAFDELSLAKTAAETEFASVTAAAKSVFDQEQKTFTAQLVDYSRQRVAAINNYLGQIAIATSKYNQSADSNAYETYKQEQTAAFDVYSQAVNKISLEENKIVEQKKLSEDKHNSAITAAQNKLNQTLAQIQADYQAKTASKNCSV